MPEIKDIQWSEETGSNDQCCYDHVIGEYPMGRVLITWKSWKDDPSFDVECDNFGWIGTEYSLKDAKQLAQRNYHDIITNCIIAD